MTMLTLVIKSFFEEKIHYKQKYRVVTLISYPQEVYYIFLEKLTHFNLITSSYL